MKKFSELTDSDFDYLKEDTINTLSRKMILNTKRKEVINTYKTVYDAVKNLKDRSMSRTIIVCIIKFPCIHIIKLYFLIIYSEPYLIYFYLN